MYISTNANYILAELSYVMHLDKLCPEEFRVSKICVNLYIND